MEITKLKIIVMKANHSSAFSLEAKHSKSYYVFFLNKISLAAYSFNCCMFSKALIKYDALCTVSLIKNLFNHN